jgi:small subunit ribosomal protein S17
MAEETENTEETETPAAPDSGADAVTEASTLDTESVSEAEPGEPEQPADDAAQAPTQSEPKRKRKRLPRGERPVKTRRTRTPSTERKKITRQATAQPPRGRRQERRGVVVSDAGDKTIVVKVDSVRAHPKYKKVIRRSIKFHAHDEQNSAHVGDVVRIVETRPLSKTKRWRLAEIVEKAK